MCFITERNCFRKYRNIIIHTNTYTVDNNGIVTLHSSLLKIQPIPIYFWSNEYLRYYFRGPKNNQRVGKRILICARIEL